MTGVAVVGAAETTELGKVPVSYTHLTLPTRS